MTPLYLQHNAPPKPPDNCHLGLWYTNFFNRYNDRWTLDATAKSDWISSIAHKVCGDSNALEQQASRLLQLIKALNGQFAICQTNWHFATGLGLPHPVENGLAWHPTLGVPFLAGSAMKGLLRAWVEVWDETDRAQRLINWFGEQEQAGQLIFFDAIPTKPVRLTTDIMTPHYGKWYEQGHDIQETMATVLEKPDRLPADWHEPVPVPFLAVKPNTPFFVAVAARNKDHQLAQTALNALTDALQWLGAGAKTAAGYGHMIRDEGTEQYLLEQLAKAETERQRLLKKQQQAEQIQQLPSFIAEVIQQPSQEADYLRLLKALDTERRWQDNREQEQQVAEYIKKRLKDEKKWKESSSKKNPQKDKPYQQTLTVMKYLSV